MGIKVWEGSNLSKTFNYDDFNFLDYNREIDHEKKVEKSIKEIGELPIPIIVNEKNEIIDGQHRFVVCKKLGLPVFYITVPGLSIKQCGTINSASKTWTTKNRAHSYTSPEYEDNDSYIFYELLIEEFKEINVTIISDILAPLYGARGRTVRSMVKDKKLIIRDEDYEYMREKCRWFLELMQIQDKLKGTTENLWEAISYAYEMTAVDNDRLKKRIIDNISSLTPVGDLKSALTSLEEIYNKGKKKSGPKTYFSVEYDKVEAKYDRKERT